MDHQFKFPTEQQLEIAISEFQEAPACDGKDSCEACAFNQHLRVVYEKSGNPSILDQLVIGNIETHPMLKLYSLADEAFLKWNLNLFHMIFLLGYKIGKNEEASKVMAKEFGEFDI